MSPAVGFSQNFPGLDMPISVLQPGDLDMKQWSLQEKKISREFNSWDGMAANYKQWVARIHDHAQICNFNWRRLLDMVRSSPVRLTRSVLQTLVLDDIQPHHLTALSFNVVIPGAWCERHCLQHERCTGCG